MPVSITEDLPVNKEAEQRLIASVLITPSAISKVEYIKPEYFYTNGHQLIWKAILSMELPDKFMLIELLRQQKVLTQVGGDLRGREYILDLYTWENTSGRIKVYAQQVLNIAIRRKAIERAIKTIDEAIGYSNPEIAPFLETIEENAVKVSSMSVDRRGPVSFKKIKSQIIEDLKNRYNNPDRAIIKTGFIDIDKAMGGFEPGGFYLVGARTHHGKSEFSMNVAINIAKQLSKGEVVLYFSTEQPDIDIGKRVTQMLVGASASQMRIPQDIFDEAQFDVFIKQIERINAQLIIDSTPSPTPGYVSTTIRQIQTIRDVKLVILDWVGMMNPVGTNAKNDAEKYKYLHRMVKQIAILRNVPILATDQVKVSVDDRNNKQPQIGDIMHGVSSFADVILTVLNPLVYNPQTTEANQLFFYKAKDRFMGNPTTVTLYRNPVTGRHENIQKGGWTNA